MNPRKPLIPAQPPEDNFTTTIDGAEAYERGRLRDMQGDPDHRDEYEIERLRQEGR
jgi:hypothetical protein